MGTYSDSMIMMINCGSSLLLLISFSSALREWFLPTSECSVARGA